MAQNAAGTDDYVIHPRCDGLHFGSADENAKRVMLLGNAPRTAPGPRQMHLAVPSFHDDIILIAASASEAHAFPERNGGRQVIARNYGECADAGCIRHRLLLS